MKVWFYAYSQLHGQNQKFLIIKHCLNIRSCIDQHYLLKILEKLIRIRYLCIYTYACFKRISKSKQLQCLIWRFHLDFWNLKLKRQVLSINFDIYFEQKTFLGKSRVNSTLHLQLESNLVVLFVLKICSSYFFQIYHFSCFINFFTFYFWQINSNLNSVRFILSVSIDANLQQRLRKDGPHRFDKYIRFSTGSVF